VNGQYVVGLCGTGKSHLAQALGHCAVRHGYDVLFCSQTQLLGTLNAARATGSYERRFQALARVQVLLIDLCGVRSYVE
jgi:DNA replication protein DnaC